MIRPWTWASLCNRSLVRSMVISELLPCPSQDWAWAAYVTLVGMPLGISQGEGCLHSIRQCGLFRHRNQYRTNRQAVHFCEKVLPVL